MMRRGFSEAGPVSVSRRRLLASMHSSRRANAGGLHAGSGVHSAPQPRSNDLALMRTSPLAAVIGCGAAFTASEQGPVNPVARTGLFATTPTWLASAAANEVPVPVSVRAKYNLADGEDGGAPHRGTNGATISDLLRASADPTAATCACAHRGPPLQSGLEAEAEEALDAATTEMLEFKAGHLADRPAWVPPQPPTPRDCDELAGKVRAMAFPEFYSAAPDAPDAGPSQPDAPPTAGGDRAAMKSHIRNITRTVGPLLQRALVIDALDEAASLRRDPGASHESKLGASVARMPRDEAMALAEAHAHQVVMPAFVKELTRAARALNADVDFTLEKDPATASRAEVALTYPGITALVYHRTAHALLRAGAPMMLARLISERAHSVTGVDIHPGATIGPGLYIDHGTGLVVGGTAIIGSRVNLFHGVTLGSRAFPTDAEGRVIKGQPRHPVVEDGVSIFAGATVLGRITLGTGATVAAGVTIMKDLPAGHVAALPKVPPTIIPPKPQ